MSGGVKIFGFSQSQRYWTPHPAKPPLAIAGGGFLPIFGRICSGFRDYRDHIFEQDLKRHGMAATQMGNEKLAVTLKDPVFELYFVGIVIAIEGELEPLELKSMSFFRIAFRFLNLADHPIVHVYSPYFDRCKKARVRTRAFSSLTFYSWRVILA
jgi:hypothetical protein